MNKATKKVIIVGGGLAGLTAGIYCRDNGFDTAVYEKHTVPGGECTGWTRLGNYIEGCAHWLVGTNPSSDLYPLWKHIGAIQDDLPLYENDSLTLVELPSGKVTGFYSDLKKTEKEWLSLFPEDKKNIKAYIKGVKAYSHVRVPTKKPLCFYSPFEWAGFGLDMLPMLGAYTRYKKVSIGQFASSCVNPEFGELFTRTMRPDYNMHSLLYTMQALCNQDADMVGGGSLAMMRRVKNTFVEKGGDYHSGIAIKKVVMEKGKAKGVLLENDDFVPADYVIIATDVHHAYTKLLSDLPMDPYYAKRFAKPASFPVNTAYFLSFSVGKDLSDYPKQIEYCSDIAFRHRHITSLPTRNFAFDPSLPRKEGTTVVTILIPASETDYQDLKSLSKEDYKKAKEELGEACRKVLVEKYGTEDIKTLDVATPLTYERYCNAYHGSYMSFVDTVDAKGIIHSARVKGAKNVILAGQWLMAPGGLPIAMFTGKNAAYTICKLSHRKFINKEKEKPAKRLTPKCHKA